MPAVPGGPFSGLRDEVVVIISLIEAFAAKVRPSARRICSYTSTPSEIDARPVSASFNVTAFCGDLNRNLPPGFNALATLPITIVWTSAGNKNIKPHATTPSNWRRKNSESSTAAHSASASGHRARNSAIIVGDASTP